MPFVISLKNHELVIVQGRAVVEQREGKEPTLLTIETSATMVAELEKIFADNPILSVGRLTQLVPGFNEVVWRPVTGEPQQISEYSFGINDGLAVDRVTLVPIQIV